MYPDFPKSNDDLVPLPKCEGPKLSAFDFKGKQDIEFLDFLGAGAHAYVFKVKILGEIYALKLFRFNNEHWLGPATNAENHDLDLMTAFYNYSDPFSCECRAFGRLKEAGHEELALRCYGYVLLDREHEQTMMSKFEDFDLSFKGDFDEFRWEDIRSFFPAVGDREPPIRGIVKDYCPNEEESLRAPTMRKVLGDIIKLQKLGITNVDVAMRQVFGDRFGDFSTTITTPHYRMTPELNPHLTPDMISAVEFETFKVSLNDFLEFDDMIQDWNWKHGKTQGNISVKAFPTGHNCQSRYNLRSRGAGAQMFTFVDPRKYDWKAHCTDAEAEDEDDSEAKYRGAAYNLPGKTRGDAPKPKVQAKSGKISKASRQRKTRAAALKKTSRRLTSRPDLWRYACEDPLWVPWLKKGLFLTPTKNWEYENGFFYPLPSLHRLPKYATPPTP